MIKKHQLKIAVLTLSALAFVSCKKDEKPAVTGDMMRFTATIGGGGEKTAIYDGKKVKWTEKDSVLINGKVFHSELEDDGKTAVFTGEALEAAEYEAYYLTDYSKSGDKYVLPATQKYAAGGTLSGINPMYAKSATTDLQFYNICAVMKLVVKGKGNVKTITVSANEPLSGAFTVESDAAVGYYAKLTSTSKDAATLTLDCGDGVALSEANSTTFYVALPQGEYTNLKFTLNGGLSWSSEAFSMNLTAGKLRTKELIGVDVVKPATLPGEFSVSANTKVRFSRGNLYHNGADDASKMNSNLPSGWNFYENQYDCYASGTTSVTDEMEINLFTWGYGTWSTVYDTQLYETGSTMTDWGTAPGLPSAGEGKKWSTLTKDEWNYLLNSRTASTIGSTSNARYAEVKVNGVCGMMLFPDEFTWPSDVTSKPATFNTNSSTWNDGVDYGTADFGKLESAGVVFLPAAGYRLGSYVYDVGSDGYYWSSTYDDSSSAYGLRFNSGGVNPQYYYNRDRGRSVRLVR